MMRKIVSIFLVMILCMTALSACTGGESSFTPEETTESATDKPDQTTPAPTETDPPETLPPETEAPAPIDPSELHFAPEDYPVIDGSTATKPLAKAFQEALTGEEGVEINHSKTGKAYTKLVDGEVDLILVVEPSEDNKAYANEHKVTLKLSKVANEGFVFFVNKRNPISSLTADQIRKIYSGEITNWKEVGGNDAEIVAFQRPVNSGSQTGMESIVMGDVPLMEPVTEHIAGSMEDIIDVISAFDGGENAIGYSYYYYANTMYLGENIKMIGVDGVMPNNTTICDMEYPFLTAYYAVTREGDESAATRDLLNYMLSEYGQVNVRDSGYVPVFDVGTAPSGDKETSDERTIHLSDTYDEDDIRITYLNETKGESYTLTYARIDGLLDKEVQEKINKALYEEAEKAYDDAFEHYAFASSLYVYTTVTSAVADTLSVRILGHAYGVSDSYFAPHFLNFRLSDGERLTLYDLFKSDTEGKDIFNTSTYTEILYQIGLIGTGENWMPRIEDYNDVEDLMLDLVQSFNAHEDRPFTFDADSFSLACNVGGEFREISIRFASIMEEVTIFGKYVSETSLYTGEFLRAKGIPVLIDRYNEAYGLYERGDNYYINLSVVELPFEQEEVCEAFSRFYERRLAYIRAMIDRYTKEGKYVLFETGYGMGWYDEPQKNSSLPATYQASGNSTVAMMVLDTREEFEATYELLVDYMRNYNGESSGPGNLRLVVLGWALKLNEDGSVTTAYDVKERFEGLLYLKGYKELRPYAWDAVRLASLKDNTPEEMLEKLKTKELELPEIYVKQGNEASVVNMVVSEILAHPERLTERDWTYQDIFLLEAADRIADCIRP